jgi:ATP-dependent RNA helicase DeaD
VAVTLAEPREHRMLKTIERVTGAKITMEKVPTVADLQARQLELTRAGLREALLGDGAGAELERFRPVVEALSDEFDVMEVALAAVKLAHEATTTSPDDQDIPESRPVRDDEPPVRRGPPGARPDGARPGGPGAHRTSGAPMTRLFVGLGRAAGMRPQDLVGAIAGESQLRGKDIGAIEISDRFSLVDVPTTAADDVVKALRGAVLRGRKATVRRDRG